MLALNYLGLAVGLSVAAVLLSIAYRLLRLNRYEAKKSASRVKGVSDVAEREAQIRAYREIMELRSERLEEEAWSVADIFMDRFRRDSMRKDELLSIRMFIQRLDVYEVREAMEIAVMKKTWPPHAFKYFCGVCWTKIRDKEA